MQPDSETQSTEHQTERVRRLYPDVLGMVEEIMHSTKATIPQKLKAAEYFAKVQAEANRSAPDTDLGPEIRAFLSAEVRQLAV